VGLTLALAAAAAAPPRAAHAFYIYHCAGYTPNNPPPDCRANPYSSPGTHQWLTDRAPAILRNDGFRSAAGLLGSPLGGSTYLRWLMVGVVTADRGPDGGVDSGLNGCTSYGRSVGWPIGDHLLNPYRGFGVWSYARSPRLGWVGNAYVSSAGRTVGACAGSPRVLTNSARMADEFFARARAAWSAGLRHDAMFNLGIALHTVQDAVVPSHAHPEVLPTWLKVRAPDGGVVQGKDAFPAWAEANKASFPVSSGGLYALPSSVNGVGIANSPGGWTYWMAAASYPYFPWSANWSAIPRGAVRCDASDFPENCRNASIRLLQRAQRVGAGFLRYFLAAVGDPAANRG
jgi:hypothetical protein